jgi:N-acetylated-alpha-linked acidic dipeptidase
LQVLHTADADVLPYDYVTYAKEIGSYVKAAEKKSDKAGMKLDFNQANAAAGKMLTNAESLASRQKAPSGDLNTLNSKLRQVEGDLLNPHGLPGRPWFRHTIYAPGEYTGYAAVVIPGVNEAIDAKDRNRAQKELNDLTAALDRASGDLKAAAGE